MLWSYRPHRGGRAPTPLPLYLQKGQRQGDIAGHQQPSWSQANSKPNDKGGEYYSLLCFLETLIKNSIAMNEWRVGRFTEVVLSGCPGSWVSPPAEHLLHSWKEQNCWRLPPLLCLWFFSLLWRFILESTQNLAFLLWAHMQWCWPSDRFLRSALILTVTTKGNSL